MPPSQKPNYWPAITRGGIVFLVGVVVGVIGKAVAFAPLQYFGLAILAVGLVMFVAVRNKISEDSERRLRQD